MKPIRPELDTLEFEEAIANDRELPGADGGAGIAAPAFRLAV